MDDFGIFARDLGFRPSGKSAPMKPSGYGSERPPAKTTSSSMFSDDQFGDVFGGPPKYSSTSNMTSSSEFDYDSIFKNNESKRKVDEPVYDKPVYDDDIFDGLPGLKSKSMSSSGGNYEENVFAGMSSGQRKVSGGDQFDDLLGNLGRRDKGEPKQNVRTSPGDFDDLLPGFGSSSPSNRYCLYLHCLYLLF